MKYSFNGTRILHLPLHWKKKSHITWYSTWTKLVNIKSFISHITYSGRGVILLKQNQLGFKTYYLWNAMPNPLIGLFFWEVVKSFYKSFSTSKNFDASDQRTFFLITLFVFCISSPILNVSFYWYFVIEDCSLQPEHKVLALLVAFLL